MSSSRGPSSRGRGRGGDRGGRGSIRGNGDGGRGGRGGGGGGGGARGGGRGGRGFNESSSFRGDFRGRGRGQDSGYRGRGGPRGGGYDHGPTVYSPPGGFQPPRADVEQIEDVVAAALSTKQREPVGYPERPGYGTRGQPVLLYANYFELETAGKQLFRYHVDIAVDSSGKQPAGRKARQIVSLLLEDHFSQFKKSIVSDYKSTLVTNMKILEQEQAQYDVRYRDEHQDEYPAQPKVYRVKVQFTGALNPSDLLSYLTSTNATAMFESKADILQAMNIVFGHHPKTSPLIASVGSNKHYAVSGGLEEKYDLGAGLEALRGFWVSVRAATARLLVNVQVKYNACYQEGPLEAIISEYQRSGYSDVHSLGRFLKGIRVRVTHIERRNKKGEIIPRIKTIAKLATRADGASLPHPPKVSGPGAGPRDVQFFLEAPGQQNEAGKGGKKPAKAGPSPAGKYVSVADFFQKHYNTKLDPRMPVVNVGTTENPSYLPVEVCIVEPGQPAKAKLTPNQTRNMLRFAVRRPPLNANTISANGNSVLGLSPPNPTLVEFGIQTDLRLITVPGRVLPAPSINYKDLKLARKSIKPMSGSWNMKAIKFSTPSRLTSWTWILFATPGGRQAFRDPQAFNNCLQQFADKLNEVGVNASSPRQGMRVVLESNGDHEEVVDRTVSELVSKHNPELIFTILPFADSSLYNSIKKVCDIRYGVRNVSVLAEKFSGANEQYFANVGLKFNLKLGGSNQTLNSSDLGIIAQGKTMLVGIDVTHPSPGSTSQAPSVASMVASVDASLGQWPAELRVQTAREEMVADLETMLKAHLQRWARGHKNALPENLVIYRDGVSEGQYDLVLQKELPLLRKACKDTYPATDTAKGLPQISVIIVGKRHHTRFYPTKEHDADRSGNSSNGTVVDRGVTEARNWDFYLQAHTALQGTARPAHYFTVWDEIFLRQKASPPFQNAADSLEALTHHMCYLFGRATKAVSICPPAYYADLACTRARCYLSQVFEQSSSASVVTGSDPGRNPDSTDVRIHPNVRDTMFYI